MALTEGTSMTWQLLLSSNYEAPLSHLASVIVGQPSALTTSPQSPPRYHSLRAFLRALRKPDYACQMGGTRSQGLRAIYLMHEQMISHNLL